MPGDGQTRLLCVLSEREITAIGRTDAETQTV
jgi:transcriptional regulator of acetoin/glycerol metabolism